MASRDRDRTEGYPGAFFKRAGFTQPSTKKASTGTFGREARFGPTSFYPSSAQGRSPRPGAGFASRGAGPSRPGGYAELAQMRLGTQHMASLQSRSRTPITSRAASPYNLPQRRALTPPTRAPQPLTPRLPFSASPAVTSGRRPPATSPVTSRQAYSTAVRGLQALAVPLQPPSGPNTASTAGSHTLQAQPSPSHSLLADPHTNQPRSNLDAVPLGRRLEFGDVLPAAALQAAGLDAVQYPAADPAKPQTHAQRDRLALLQQIRSRRTSLDVPLQDSEDHAQAQQQPSGSAASPHLTPSRRLPPGAASQNPAGSGRLQRDGAVQLQQTRSRRTPLDEPFQDLGDLGQPQLHRDGLAALRQQRLRQMAGDTPFQDPGDDWLGFYEKSSFGFLKELEGILGGLAKLGTIPAGSAERRAPPLQLPSASASAAPPVGGPHLAVHLEAVQSMVRQQQQQEQRATVATELGRGQDSYPSHGQGQHRAGRSGLNAGLVGSAAAGGGLGPIAEAAAHGIVRGGGQAMSSSEMTPVLPSGTVDAAGWAGRGYEGSGRYSQPLGTSTVNTPGPALPAEQQSSSSTTVAPLPGIGQSPIPGGGDGASIRSAAADGTGPVPGQPAPAVAAGVAERQGAVALSSLPKGTLAELWNVLQASNQNTARLVADLAAARREVELANERAEEADDLARSFQQQLLSRQKHVSSWQAALAEMEEREVSAKQLLREAEERCRELAERAQTAEHVAATVQMRFERMAAQRMAEGREAEGSPGSVAREGEVQQARMQQVSHQLHLQLQHLQADLAAAQTRATRAELELAVARNKALIAQQELAAEEDRARRAAAAAATAREELGRTRYALELMGRDHDRLRRRLEDLRGMDLLDTEAGHAARGHTTPRRATPHRPRSPAPSGDASVRSPPASGSNRSRGGTDSGSDRMQSCPPRSGGLAVARGLSSDTGRARIASASSRRDTDAGDRAQREPRSDVNTLSSASGSFGGGGGGSLSGDSSGTGSRISAVHAAANTGDTGADADDSAAVPRPSGHSSPFQQRLGSLLLLVPGDVPLDTNASLRYSQHMKGRGHSRSTDLGVAAASDGRAAAAGLGATSRGWKHHQQHGTDQDMLHPDTDSGERHIAGGGPGAGYLLPGRGRWMRLGTHDGAVGLMGSRRNGRGVSARGGAAAALSTDSDDSDGRDLRGYEEERAADGRRRGADESAAAVLDSQASSSGGGGLLPRKGPSNTLTPDELLPLSRTPSSATRQRPSLAGGSHGSGSRGVPPPPSPGPLKASSGTDSVSSLAQLKPRSSPLRTATTTSSAESDRQPFTASSSLRRRAENSSAAGAAIGVPHGASTRGTPVEWDAQEQRDVSLADLQRRVSTGVAPPGPCASTAGGAAKDAAVATAAAADCATASRPATAPSPSLTPVRPQPQPHPASPGSKVGNGSSLASAAGAGQSDGARARSQAPASASPRTPTQPPTSGLHPSDSAAGSAATKAAAVKGRIRLPGLPPLEKTYSPPEPPSGAGKSPLRSPTRPRGYQPSPQPAVEAVASPAAKPTTSLPPAVAILAATPANGNTTPAAGATTPLSQRKAADISPPVGYHTSHLNDLYESRQWPVQGLAAFNTRALRPIGPTTEVEEDGETAVEAGAAPASASSSGGEDEWTAYGRPYDGDGKAVAAEGQHLPLTPRTRILSPSQLDSYHVRPSVSMSASESASMSASMAAMLASAAGAGSSAAAATPGGNAGRPHGQARAILLAEAGDVTASPNPNPATTAEAVAGDPNQQRPAAETAAVSGPLNSDVGAQSLAVSPHDEQRNPSPQAQGPGQQAARGGRPGRVWWQQLLMVVGRRQGAMRPVPPTLERGASPTRNAVGGSGNSSPRRRKDSRGQNSLLSRHGSTAWDRTGSLLSSAERTVSAGDGSPDRMSARDRKASPQMPGSGLGLRERGGSRSDNNSSSSRSDTPARPRVELAGSQVPPGSVEPWRQGHPTQQQTPPASVAAGAGTAPGSAVTMRAAPVPAFALSDASPATSSGTGAPNGRSHGSHAGDKRPRPQWHEELVRTARSAVVHLGLWSGGVALGVLLVLGVAGVVEGALGVGGAPVTLLECSCGDGGKEGCKVGGRRGCVGGAEGLGGRRGCGLCEDGQEGEGGGKRGGAGGVSSNGRVTRRLQ